MILFKCKERLQREAVQNKLLGLSDAKCVFVEMKCHQETNRFNEDNLLSFPQWTGWKTLARKLRTGRSVTQ